MKSKCTIKAGFTLIELLVVISIIALLISLLLPALNNAHNQGKKIVCSSQLHQLSIAHTSYQHDHEDWIVPATQQ